MSLRFFSDQCVPFEIADTLRQAGHEVILLRSVLPIRSPDAAVMAQAQVLGAILLSLNGDFADIVAYPPSGHLGVVAIQLHNHPEIMPQLMDRLIRFIREHPAQEFYRQKLLVVEVHRLRVRQ